MKLQLPWEECRNSVDNQNIMKEFIFDLGKKTALLQREMDELDREF